ncbi:MAG: hypothetical protein NT001_05145 [Candidatus Woesearchaeota archaeon]|nr:hypothetical protein [Candidatus Woesearchaeota archaeon]
MNRRGLVDNLRFKGVVKTMSSDLQSIFLVMAGDTQSVSNDLFEDLKETRMSLMIFSMKMRGLVPPFQTPAERLTDMISRARLPDFSALSRLSRIPAAVSSVMALLVFFHR